MRNRIEFPGSRFVAGDVFDFLRDHRIDALLHINVGVYFLPALIGKLYAAAREAGARYLIAFEPSGISRQTNRYYSYGPTPSPSVVFRGPMLLHNYPNLMLEQGFEIVHQELVRPPHPDGDFRSAFFLSKVRDEGGHNA